MKKTTLVSIALATALSTVAMAQSTTSNIGLEDRKKSNYGQKTYRGKRSASPIGVIHSLDLSDDQKTALRAIKQERIDSMGSWESKKAQKIANIKKAFEGNQFNAEVYIQSQTSNATQKAQNHAQDLQQMIAILTASQKEQFFKKIQELK